MGGGRDLQQVSVGRQGGRKKGRTYKPKPSFPDMQAT